MGFSRGVKAMRSNPPSSVRPRSHEEEVESPMLFQSLPIGVIYQNQEGKILTANPAAEKILGLSLDQMRGVTSADPRWRAIREDHSPFPGDQHPAMVALRTGKVVKDIQMGVSNPKKEDLTWINISSFPIEGREGVSGIGVYTIFEDITERKKNKLAEISANRLAAIVDSSDDAIIGKDLDGTITSWNHGAEIIFGYTASEMVGTSILQLIPEERHKEEQYFQETIRRGEKVTSFETVRLTKEGRRIDVSVTVSPIRKVAGQIIGISKVARDITERKKTERDLEAKRTKLETEEKERRRLEHLIWGSKIGTYEWNIQTGETVLNEQWAHIVGHTLQELKPLSVATWTSRIHPDDLTKTMDEVESHFRGETSCFSNEFRLRHQEGRWVWVRSVGSVISRTADGKPLMMYGMIQDISETKELVEQLKESSRRAESANIAKSAFLATMSHEIRTPLNAIIGMSELLEFNPSGPDAKEALHTINICGESLLGLINDILDFSKIEAGQLELEKLTINPKKCADDAVEIVTLKAHQKGLSLQMNVDPLVPEEILGDYQRLRQILVNLITNAVKFTEQGGVKIEISVEHLAEQRMIRFSIADSGIGISPEDQKKLFHNFSQVDSTISRRYGGTGLGLAISKRLVDLMGGSIKVESSLGEGSTFSFSIPAVAAEPSKKETACVSNPSYTTTLLGKRCPLKILVAEDNLINQRVLQMMLKRLGYEATFVANGLEAVTATEKTPIDIILMDVHMPVMNGLEAAAKICEIHPPESRPYMIAQTASTMDEDKKNCWAVGMNEFLSKPLHFEHLSTTLEEAFVKIKGKA